MRHLISFGTLLSLVLITPAQASSTDCPDLTGHFNQCQRKIASGKMVSFPGDGFSFSTEGTPDGSNQITMVTSHSDSADTTTSMIPDGKNYNQSEGITLNASCSHKVLSIQISMPSAHYSSSIQYALSGDQLSRTSVKAPGALEVCQRADSR